MTTIDFLRGYSGIDTGTEGEEDNALNYLRNYKKPVVEEPVQEPVVEEPNYDYQALEENVTKLPFDNLEEYKQSLPANDVQMPQYNENRQVLVPSQEAPLPKENIQSGLDELNKIPNTRTQPSILPQVKPVAPMPDTGISPLQERQMSSPERPEDSQKQYALDLEEGRKGTMQAINNAKNRFLTPVRDVIKKSREVKAKYGINENALMEGFYDSLVRMPEEDRYKAEGLLQKAGYIAGSVGENIGEFALISKAIPKIPAVEKIPMVGNWVGNILHTAGSIGAMTLVDELAEKDPDINRLKTNLKAQTPFMLAFGIAPYVSGLRYSTKPQDITFMKKMLGLGYKFSTGGAIAFAEALREGNSFKDSVIIGIQAGGMVTLTGAKMLPSGVPITKGQSSDDVIKLLEEARVRGKQPTPSDGTIATAPKYKAGEGTIPMGNPDANFNNTLIEGANPNAKQLNRFNPDGSVIKQGGQLQGEGSIPMPESPIRTMLLPEGDAVQMLLTEAKGIQKEMFNALAGADYKKARQLDKQLRKLADEYDALTKKPEPVVEEPKKKGFTEEISQSEYANDLPQLIEEYDLPKDSKLSNYDNMVEKVGSGEYEAKKIQMDIMNDEVDISDTIKNTVDLDKLKDADKTDEYILYRKPEQPKRKEPTYTVTTTEIEPTKSGLKGTQTDKKTYTMDGKEVEAKPESKIKTVSEVKEERLKEKEQQAKAKNFSEKLTIEEVEKFVKQKGLRSTPEEYAKLKADIEKNGITEPIVIGYDSKKNVAELVEGNHRLAIAKELGLKKIPVVVQQTGVMRGGVPVKGFRTTNYNIKPSDIGIGAKANITHSYNSTYSQEELDVMFTDDKVTLVEGKDVELGPVQYTYKGIDIVNNRAKTLVGSNYFEAMVNGKRIHHGYLEQMISLIDDAINKGGQDEPSSMRESGKENDIEPRPKEVSEPKEEIQPREFDTDGNRPSKRESTDGGERSDEPRRGLVKSIESIPDKVIEAYTANQQTLKESEVTDAVLSKKDALSYEQKGGKKGASGADILSAYFTPESLSKRMQFITHKLMTGKDILEPSIGSGNLIDVLNDKYNITGIEINQRVANVAKSKFPKATIYNTWTEKFFHDNTKKFDAVIMNPPYNSYISFFKTKYKDTGVNSYTEFFLRESSKVLKRNGVLVSIHPHSFMANGVKPVKAVMNSEGMEILKAFRLPDGMFGKSVKIPIDMVIMKKTGSLVEDRWNNNKYFEENPADVLGETSIVKGNYGKEVEVIKGDIDEAMNKISEYIKTIEENKETPTGEVLQEPKAGVEEVKGKGKEVKEVSGTKTDIGQVGEKYLEAIYGNLNYDGSTNISIETNREVLNYEDGKVYPNEIYVFGNIAEKLKQLEADRDNMSVEQYNKQKKLLESVRPKQLKAKEMELDPTVSYFANKDLVQDYKRWIWRSRKYKYGLGSNDIDDYFKGRLSGGAGQKKNYSSDLDYAKAVDKEMKKREDRKKFVRETFKEYLEEIEANDAGVIQEINDDLFSNYIPKFDKFPFYIKDMSKTFKGKELVISKHQKEAIGFLSAKNIGYFSGEVGSGKTMVNIIMVEKSLQSGRSKRPVIIAPKDIIQNFLSEYPELFPKRKLVNLENLGATIKLPKIQDGNVHLMSYEALSNIKYKPENIEEIKAFLDKQTSSEGVDKRTKEIDSLKLDSLIAKVGDKGYYFDDLNFDLVSFDEAHAMRNLFSFKSAEYKKMPATNPSAVAVKGYVFSANIFLKNNFQNIFMFSATPFNNKPDEIYNVLSFVAFGKMKDMGVSNLEDFTKLFAGTTYDWTVGANNDLKKQQVVTGFNNATLLRQLIRTYVLPKFSDELDLVRPDKKRIMQFLPESEKEKDVIGPLRERYSNLKKLDADTQKKERLSLQTAIRKSAVSPYLLEDISEVPAKEVIENSSKLKYIVDQIKNLYDQNNDSGQIIYNPLGKEVVPKIIEYLVKYKKFKPEQIAFISGDTSKKLREKYQDDFNNGKVKVLIGTSAIKQGLNLQSKTVAMYSTLIEWNPTDVIQFEGRGYRQGNQFKDIYSIYPLLENSGDAVYLQKVEEKSKRFNDIWEGKSNYIDTSDVNPEQAKLDIITDPVKKAEASIAMEIEKVDDALAEIKQNLDNIGSMRTGRVDLTDQWWAGKLNVERINKLAEKEVLDVKEYADLVDETKKALDAIYKPKLEAKFQERINQFESRYNVTFKKSESRSKFLDKHENVPYYAYPTYPKVNELYIRGNYGNSNVITIDGIDEALVDKISNAVDKKNSAVDELSTILETKMETVAKEKESIEGTKTDLIRKFTKEANIPKPPIKMLKTVEYRNKKITSLSSTSGYGGKGIPENFIPVEDRKKGGYGKVANKEGEGTKKKRGMPTEARVAENVNYIREALRITSPASVSYEAKMASFYLRKNFGELAKMDSETNQAFKQARKELGKLSNDEIVEYIDSIERGTSTDPYAKIFREALNERRDKLQDLGYLEKFNEDYFPRIWKNPQEDIKKVVASFFSKKSIKGSKSFLKERTLEFFKDGIDRGLEPIEWNPVDIISLKLHEMDKFILANKMISELKQAQMIKFVYARVKPPEGYVKLEDRAFTVFAPPEVNVQESYDKILVEQLMTVAESLGIDAKRFVNLGKSSKTMGYAQGARGEEGGVIRTKFASPESVLAHEIGHLIGHRYELYDTLRKVGEGKSHTIKKGKNIGQEAFVPSKEAVAFRKVIDKEWRDLADARGKDSVITPSFQKYIRKTYEKEAVLMEAFIHAPKSFQDIAPKLYAEFVGFLNSKPELRPILDIEPSLVLGQSTGKVRVAGFITVGNYYAPKDIASLINNHLSSGLKDNKNILIRDAYNAIRGIGNMVNQIQLSGSFFHGLNITMDMQASAISLGIRKLITKGQRVSGLLDIFSSPIAPVGTMWNGMRIKKAYKQSIDTITDPRLRRMVESVVNAGGRVEMDMQYYNNAIKHLENSLRDIFKSNDIKKMAVGTAKLPLDVLGATIEMLAKPIMQWYVPSGKIGVFANMAQYELKRLDAGEIDEDQLMLRLMSAWDSVDNRMGQMVYDNLFWNKYLKDTLFVTLRATGWYMGNIRETSGAFKDILTTRGRIAEGDKVISNRTAQLIGWIATYMLIGGAVMKLTTGKTPETKEDWFFPQINEAGDRITMPTYAKDWFAMANDPVKTAKGKLHPVWSIANNIVKNRDWKNVEIRDTKDPLGIQLMEVGNYITTAVLPIPISAIKQASKERELNAGDYATFIAGINTAPRYISSTTAEKLMLRYVIDRIPDSTISKKDNLKREYRNMFIRKLRKGERVNRYEARQILGSDSFKRAIKDAKLEPFEVSFKRLKFEEALNVYNVGTKKEKNLVRRILIDKYSRYKNKLSADEKKLYYKILNNK